MRLKHLRLAMVRTVLCNQDVTTRRPSTDMMTSLLFFCMICCTILLRSSLSLLRFVMALRQLRHRQGLSSSLSNSSDQSFALHALIALRTMRPGRRRLLLSRSKANSSVYSDSSVQLFAQHLFSRLPIPHLRIPIPADNLRFSIACRLPSAPSRLASNCNIFAEVYLVWRLALVFRHD